MRNTFLNLAFSLFNYALSIFIISWYSCSWKWCITLTTYKFYLAINNKCVICFINWLKTCHFTTWYLPLSLSVKNYCWKWLSWLLQSPPSHPTLVAPESWNRLLEPTEKAAWTLALGNTSEDLQPSSQLQFIS